MTDQLYVTLDVTPAFRAFGNLHRNNGANAYALWVGGASQSLSTGGAPANRVFGAGFALGSVNAPLGEPEGGRAAGLLRAARSDRGRSGYRLPTPALGDGVMAARYTRRAVIVVPDADRARANGRWKAVLDPEGGENTFAAPRSATGAGAATHCDVRRGLGTAGWRRRSRRRRCGSARWTGEGARRRRGCWSWC